MPKIDEGLNAKPLTSIIETLLQPEGGLMRRPTGEPLPDAGRSGRVRTSGWEHLAWLLGIACTFAATVLFNDRLSSQGGLVSALTFVIFLGPIVVAAGFFMKHWLPVMCIYLAFFWGFTAYSQVAAPGEWLTPGVANTWSIALQNTTIEGTSGALLYLIPMRALYGVGYIVRVIRDSRPTRT